MYTPTTDDKPLSMKGVSAKNAGNENTCIASLLPSVIRGGVYAWVLNGIAQN